MADSDNGEEITPRGNDWEVVSLTASAYAAAPGPKAVEEIVGDKGSVYGGDDVEASQTMFMSGHFVFPEKQPKDMPLESEAEYSEILEEEKIQELESMETIDEIGGGIDKDDDMKHSSTGQRSPMQPVPNVVVEPTPNVSSSVEDSNFVGASSSDVKTMISEEAASDKPADDNSKKQMKDKKKASIPCGPWWKRQAASLYDHVKDANPLWSIVIAAAVMGLAVIGKRWHQQKSQVSELNLQLFPKEEKQGKMLGPISRLKEALVSSNHGSTSVMVAPLLGATSQARSKLPIQQNGWNSDDDEKTQ